MQKKYWIIPGIMVTILVASLLALSNTGSRENSLPKPVCCKKVMKECPPKPQATPGQTSLETLSTQFISFPVN